MTRDEALLDLLAYLKARGYRFHPVTPATHARVLARPAAEALTLRDIFGWNRPFRENDVEREQLALMQAAGIVRIGPQGMTSELRVASLGEDLFLHSAYPTDEHDAVFFGPDTYRFTNFIGDRWPGTVAGRVVGLGAGSGAGGVAAARLAPEATVTLVDLNPKALRLAQLNARAAGLAVELRNDDASPPGANVIIANPPFMMDAKRRAYRNGGELLGGQVTLQWVRDAFVKLAPAGTMLLYTGAAVVKGISPLVEALQDACAEAGAAMDMVEIDPDIFGEELEQPSYCEVERIAALGLVIRMRA
jgi:methylase of polypeptide subunit release factors